LQERLRNGPGPDDWVLLGQAWIQKARRSGDTGLYLAAEGASVAALELAPGHRGALGLRAQALLNQHDFAGAREQTRVLVTRDPGDLLALATLSDAALELGDLSAAVDAGQRLLDLKPGLTAYGRAAHLRWIMGDVAGAKRLYARAIEAGRGARDPEPTAWMMVQAALLFWNEGDLGGAMAGAREALALVPDYPPALVLEGRCRLAGGETGEATRVLDRAWAARPLVETGWLLADARRRAGDEAGAEAIERKLVRDGRQSDPLMLGLFLASRNRDVPEALRMLEAEHRARPGIAVEDAYAWALFRAGRLGEARAAIDRATVHGTPEPRLLYHAGAIHLAQGEGEAGAALVRRALSLNSHFDVLAGPEAQLLAERYARRRRSAWKLQRSGPTKSGAASTDRVRRVTLP
ncbi:MAG TPA: tetratricopeptide repeat protein, partial [Myxococcaceae bacterium]|nr:tetratricopeptide repeat protein [Myxococcaceae bacterium]